MSKAAADKRTERTATFYQAGRPISATGSVYVSGTRSHNERSGKNIEAAVYTYIRALRSLGKTKVNTEEIARALGIPVSNVYRVLPKLTEKGIRRAE